MSKKPELTIITETDYEAVSSVSESLQKEEKLNICFKNSKDLENKKVSIYWTDEVPTTRKFQETKMINAQRMNRFPHFRLTSSKCFLFELLKRMKSMYPKDYDFFPTTYLLPRELGEFLKEKEEEKDDLWICKASKGSEGRGIKIGNLKEIQDHGKMLEKEEKDIEYVVQKYVKDPLLVEKKKFDIRIFVVLTSLDPLEAFYSKKGYIRLASAPYSKDFSSTNLENNFIHLTNAAVNSKNEAVDYQEGKLDYETLNKHMEKTGLKSDVVWGRIEKVIFNVLQAIRPVLLSQYLQLFERKDNRRCFQIIGFDVLLTETGKPLILEINARPQMTIYNDLDVVLKKQVVIDTFKLVGKSIVSKRMKTSDLAKDTYFVDISAKENNEKDIFIDPKLLSLYKQVLKEKDEKGEIDENKLKKILEEKLATKIELPKVYIPRKRFQYLLDVITNVAEIQFKDMKKIEALKKIVGKL